ncbi:CpaF family protein [Fusibacter bizertensis]
MYQTIEQIKKEILEEITLIDENEIRQAIHHKINQLNDYNLSDKKKLSTQLEQSIFGYGIIQPLLDRTEITEIMINGTEGIFIEIDGKLIRSDISYENKAQIMQLVHKVSTEVGREVNLSYPTLDARLKDGSRVNVVLDPIAIKGPIVTIRKFKQALGNSDDLIKSGMFDSTLARLMEILVVCKFNLFICGGTGTGKTTLLNCLSSFIEANERIITIEDAAELSLKCHQNVVTLETRKTQGSNEVTMSHLIKNALRMRPDRIIVGEVRGDEVVDMLQAMNTGHDGSLSTGHSNSPLDMLTRLEVIASSYSEINHLLIRKQIISAIDFLIFVEKLPNGNRSVTQIVEVEKGTTDYVLNSIYTDTSSKEVVLEALIKKIKLQNKIRRYYDKIEKIFI